MLRMGFFEKSCTQPALAQLIRWNFFASRRCAIIGATFSWTYASSASDSKKKGMANTLNASSISARPPAVSVAACKPSTAIRAIADDSLGIVPA